MYLWMTIKPYSKYPRENGGGINIKYAIANVHL